MKGKEVILVPKSDRLEKHAKKTKLGHDMPHLVIRKMSFM
jgi:hypothetical protein